MEVDFPFGHLRDRNYASASNYRRAPRTDALGKENLEHKVWDDAFGIYDAIFDHCVEVNGDFKTVDYNSLPVFVV